MVSENECQPRQVAASLIVGGQGEGKDWRFSGVDMANAFSDARQKS
jgi:hypothetical protein